MPAEFTLPVRMAGIVGPALSALDAHIGFNLNAWRPGQRTAKRAAQHAAAAQEARSMLGANVSMILFMTDPCWVRCTR